MEFECFIQKYGYLPVIETENLLAGIMHPGQIQVQISRWKKSGKLIQLKRGIYVLAETYRKVEIFGAYVASLLQRPSYISLEKALEFHHLIPEAVQVFTSVTTKRPSIFETPLGIFSFQHIQTKFFWGYESVTVNQQTAFMAHPEKALLDLMYFKNFKITQPYIQELRLQNTEGINLKRLMEYARRFQKPKIQKAAELIKKYLDTCNAEERTL